MAAEVEIAATALALVVLVAAKPVVILVGVEAIELMDRTVNPQAVVVLVAIEGVGLPVMMVETGVMALLVHRVIRVSVPRYQP
jgi:hypothetical protein